MKNDINLTDVIVLETPGVHRPANHPGNDKVQDSLMNKQLWTRFDCNLLKKCLENYQ